jgi:hypothetical protein
LASARPSFVGKILENFRDGDELFELFRFSLDFFYRPFDLARFGAARVKAMTPESPR